jgi:hypothetical protein
VGNYLIIGKPGYVIVVETIKVFFGFAFLISVYHTIRLICLCYPYFSFPRRAKRKVIPPSAGQAPETPLLSPHNPIARIATEARSVHNPSHLG